MTDLSQDIVTARGLTKVFGTVMAVDRIDFSVGRQECFGFLGPNGAGKTTTIKMVSCFIAPSQGELTVLGQAAQDHPRCIKRDIGVCPQEYNLDPDLNVQDNLRVFARYFDIEGEPCRRRCQELLHVMGLSAKRESAIDELSGGMKRRLMISRALLNNPKLLILDEPTTGLDPQSRHQIWESLYQFKNQGTTILLTTHDMDEASHLCDRLVIMDNGKIVVQGSPKSLIKKYMGSSVIEIPAGKKGVEEYLKDKGLDYEKTRTHYFIHSGGCPGHARGIRSSTCPGHVANGHAPGRWRPAGASLDGETVASFWPEISRKFGEDYCVLRMANLEDVFLKLTGRELREL